jgi:hypothetical protein
MRVTALGQRAAPATSPAWEEYRDPQFSWAMSRGLVAIRGPTAEGGVTSSILLAGPGEADTR